jgi:transposase
VDEVRRGEAKHQRDLLKNTRYLWLRRPKNLSARQQDWLDELLAMPLDTVRAYDLAQRFDTFYEIEDADRAEEYLDRWIDRARAANLGAPWMVVGDGPW